MHACGLAVIPCGGEEGKQPLVKHWQRWKYRPSAATLEKFAGQYPDAGIGIVTGPASGVSVIDLDPRNDKAPKTLLEYALEMYGETPLIVRTPSGGWHLYYRYDQERSQTRLTGRGVDIKAAGGFVVAPPSIRPSGALCGHPYSFHTGCWADLAKLPNLKTRNPKCRNQSAVLKGERNTDLFRYLMAQAAFCDGYDDLLDEANAFNQSCEPPLGEAEIEKTTGSVWGYEQRGENWIGYNCGQHIVVPEAIFELLAPTPDALTLYMKLWSAHAGFPDKHFAVSPKSMARDESVPGHKSVGWYSRNRDIVLESGLIERVYKGGKHCGDRHLYRLVLSPDKGTD